MRALGRAGHIGMMGSTTAGWNTAMKADSRSESERTQRAQQSFATRAAIPSTRMDRRASSGLTLGRHPPPPLSPPLL